MVRKNNLPLEIRYPNIFGQLDEMEKRLIDIGALDLVLIENASDIIRQIKDLPNFMECVIEEVMRDNYDGYDFLGSISIDITNPDIAMIRDIRKSVKKSEKKKFVLHVGLILKTGGHYGMFLVDANRGIIFDSMQIGRKSGYTKKFRIIAQWIFPYVVFKTANLPIQDEYLLQPTGGVVHSFPEDSNYDFDIQSIDSQNHFCYMWAIWWLHIFLSTESTTKNDTATMNTIMTLPSYPLIAIKRYIWSVIHFIYPSNKHLLDLIQKGIYNDTGVKLEKKDTKDILDFFLDNFPLIWIPERSFKIIQNDTDKIRKFKTINDCLSYSFCTI